MRREAINRRLDALELKAAPAPVSTITILRWPCGMCQHNGEKYSTLSLLLDAVKPADHIVADVIDYSKQEIHNA